MNHYGPVTSLKLSGDLIIAGYGPILKVFQNTKEIYRERIFERNKIHAIDVYDNLVVLAGGRSFCVMDLNKLAKVEERCVNEWITAVKIIDPHTLLVLNSHNTVYKIDLATHDLVEKIGCGWPSLLYAGSISMKGHSVYVCAGTVMHGVLIWDVGSGEIVSRMQDHEGSIFGVEMDEDQKHVVTCSDDRTVRLYEFRAHSAQLVATGWGHGSRIWKLAFVKGCSPSFVSFGEDCSARVWKYDGSELHMQTFDHIHSGKSVWSGDASNSWFVSGGADGQIRVHDIMEDVQVANDAAVKQFVRVNNNTLFLDDKGGLFLQDGGMIPYEGSEKLVKFAIMRSFGDDAVIAARNGDLLFVDLKSCTASWTQDKHLKGAPVTNLMVAPTKTGNMLLVDSPNPKIPFVVRNGDQTLLLQQPAQTSFTTTCMAYDTHNNWLVVGSRYVSLAVYELGNQTDIPLSAIFRKLCPGDSITCLRILKSGKDSIHLLITVRDGIYMIAKIGRKDGEFNISILHQNKISRGFLEGGHFEQGDLILYGFKSSTFFVWNETRSTQIWGVRCGGSHKTWSYADNVLTYLEKSQLVCRRQSARFERFGIVHTGTHGREIRDVAVGPALGGDTRLLLTASEDATVRLCEVSSSGMRMHWSMNNHVSGLQRVKFLDSSLAASCAANEEFLIWQISPSFDGKPLMKELTRLKPASNNPDLRIMDFAHVPYKEGFLICTVYSDSAIKIWYFDRVEFHPVCTDSYKSCCILNVHLLQRENSLHLLITTTDGHITVWDISETGPKLPNPLLSKQIHQNGVKAIVTIPDENGYLIVSGGDDNALAVSKMSLDGHVSLETLSHVAAAAASTITGISYDSHEIYVVSVDQVIRRWSLDLKCTGVFYTTVADTGCCDVFGECLVVGGAGLSIVEKDRLIERSD